MKKIICTKNAPEPIGPYSGAVLVEGFLYVSGQIPVDPSSGELISGGIQEQTLQVMNNLKAYLEKANMDFQDTIKVSIFIKNMDNFPKVNHVYKNFFNNTIRQEKQ